MVENILGIMKEIWCFAIIWKVLSTLFLKQQQERFGRALLGILLFLLLISPILHFSDGQLEQKLEDVFHNCCKEFENTEKLYTYDEKVKTWFDDEKPTTVEIEKSLENQRFEKIEEKNESHEINIKLLEKNEISTISVEKIQPIQKK